MSIITLNSVRVDAHSFRVTLNLLQNSECCPDDVRDVVRTLEVRLKWNRHLLSPADAETLYSEVDNGLVGRALAEWSVDTSRMRDWCFPEWRPDYTDWWDGSTRRCDCALCGHKDNRYEFPLVNSANGREIWTGSTCIVKYGVVVDGDGCAESALKRLREAMGRSKRAQSRHEWREAYPDHAEDMATIERALPIANRKYVPWRLWSAKEDGVVILPPNYDSQRRVFGKWARAAVKYYTKHGFLTAKRTEDLYMIVDGKPVPGAMVERARSIVALWERAIANDPEEQRKKKAKEFWTAFIRDNPRMNDYQRSRVDYWARRGYAPEDLYSRNKALMEEIRSANAAKKTRKTTKTATAKKLAKLPWS